MILLAVFIVILTWATFYESAASTEAVQRLVYNSVWFDLFLLVLGLNVLCSTLARYPWRKSQVGFVITHLGILILLLGAAITNQFGIEGNIALFEGESADSIILPEMALSVSVPQLNIQKDFDPWFMKKRLPEGEEIRYSIDNDTALYVERYLVNPQLSDVVTPDGTAPNPAVHLTIFQTSQPANAIDQWLLVDDPARNTLDLQKAKAVFQRVESLEALDSLLAPPKLPNLDARGELLLLDQANQVVQRINVEELINGPYTFQYNGAPYAVKFITFMPRALVENKELVNKEKGALNPLLKFEIHGPDWTESHHAFSLFPTLGSRHGKQESHSGLSGRFTYPIDPDSTFENNARILLGPEGNLYYRVMNVDGDFASGKVESGNIFQTTWNDLSMRVDEFYPQAKLTQEYIEGGVHTIHSHNPPLVFLRLEHSGETKELTAAYNSEEEVTAGTDRFLVSFGPKRIPLGFTIKLIEFSAPTYKGTKRPAQFQSLVNIIDPEQGIEREQLIYMNNPLAHRGYLFYQSSYEPGQNGAPDQSVFSVACAPGTPVIYLGSIVLVLGMIYLYFSKRRAPRTLSSGAASS